MASWIQIGGLAVLALVTLRAAGLAGGAVLRARGAARVQALELELLRQAIDAARARRVQIEEMRAAWSGWRKFEVERKVREAEGIYSFYLRPHDGKALPAFLPGQHLTFQAMIPGQSRPVIRCYSLSEAPRKDRYRVTIKRVPPGVVSSFFHDRIEAGEILDVKAPGGQFALDPLAERPVVLLAGGVGITPLLCMLEALAAGGLRCECWLFYGVRHGGEQIMQERLRELAREHPQLRLHVCYSDPRPDEIAGLDYQHAGRVDVELLRSLLPSSNYDFYICGPPPMMNALIEGLREWGVPEERVHFELFGPASVKRVAAPAAGDETIEVFFERSAQRCAWTPAEGTLLELAEARGVTIDSGCRAGSCGTCVVAVRRGEVRYATAPSFPVEGGSCLTCIARPGGPLVLDA